ncbi:hypothetical protein PMJ10TS2_53460 [Paenibacillus melissococcoides]
MAAGAGTASFSANCPLSAASSTALASSVLAASMRASSSSSVILDCSIGTIGATPSALPVSSERIKAETIDMIAAYLLGAKE